MTVAELIEILRKQNPNAVVEVSCGDWCAPAVRVRPMLSGPATIQKGGEIRGGALGGAHGTVVILDERSPLNR